MFVVAPPGPRVGRGAYGFVTKIRFVAIVFALRRSSDRIRRVAAIFYLSGTFFEANFEKI